MPTAPIQKQRATDQLMIREESYKNMFVIDLKERNNETRPSSLKIGLSGQWELLNAEHNIKVPTLIPEEVHTALARAKVIDEPYLSKNDTELRWIARERWTYQAKVEIRGLVNKEGDAKVRDVRLVLEGIDTIARVYVNNTLVLTTDNQFVEYAASIKAVLKENGENDIAIEIDSPLNVADKLAAEYPYAVPDGFTEVTHGEKWRNFLRKEQCSFSWDWGPCFATSGICKSIWIVVNYDEVAIESCSLATTPVFESKGELLEKNNYVKLAKVVNSKESFNKSLTAWDVDFNIDIRYTCDSNPDTAVGWDMCSEPFAELSSSVRSQLSSMKHYFNPAAIKDAIESHRLQITMKDRKGNIVINRRVLSFSFANVVAVREAENSDPDTPTIILSLIISHSIPKNDVELWWPNGLGEQAVYLLTTKVTHSSGSPPIFVRSFNIGFKFLQLVQEKDVLGESFMFRVNGLDFFSKGTNFIPMDCFESRITDIRLRWLLESCKAANMNMVRIWGGGIYQRNEFYDICDELGLLVWQEFMFACAMCPTNKEFLSSVRKEVAQQISRLKSHPSIALWSGNNENQTALVTGWHDEVKKDPYRYSVDYSKLYIDTIRDEVLLQDRTHEFIVSSPWNGVYQTKNDEYLIRFKVPNDQDYGDFHHYNYTIPAWDVRYMPKARFVSEYGLQGMPTKSSLLQVIKESEIGAQTDTLVYRNHLGNGQQIIVNQLKFYEDEKRKSGKQCKHGPYDPNKNSQSFIDFSQYVQRHAIVSQTAYYMSMPERCTGALYWQLNDIWQAPTWASIQYDGQWKLLHYGMKEVFAPVKIISQPGVNKLFINNYDGELLNCSLIVWTGKPGSDNERKYHIPLGKIAETVRSKVFFTEIEVDLAEATDGEIDIVRQRCGRALLLHGGDTIAARWTAQEDKFMFCEMVSAKLGLVEAVEVEHMATNDVDPNTMLTNGKLTFGNAEKVFDCGVRTTADGWVYDIVVVDVEIPEKVRSTEGGCVVVLEMDSAFVGGKKTSSQLPATFTQMSLSRNGFLSFGAVENVVVCRLRRVDANEVPLDVVVRAALRARCHFCSDN